MNRLSSLVVAVSILGLTTAAQVLAHEGEDHNPQPGQNPPQHAPGGQGQGGQQPGADKHKAHKHKDKNSNKGEQHNDGHKHQH